MNQWSSTIHSELSDVSVLEFNKRDSAKVKNVKIGNFKGNVVIVNFEILNRLPALYGKINNDWTIIVDESHRMKSPRTEVANTLLDIGKLTNYKMILTATPTQGLYGGYIDYFTQLKFLGAYKGSLKEFEDRYVEIVKMNFGNTPYPIKVITGYKNVDELKNLINSVSKSYTPRINDYDPEHIQINVDKPRSYDKIIREHAYKDIAITNISKKRIALKTLTGGIVTGTDIVGDRFTYRDNYNKSDWLQEFLEGTNENVIIFYQYNVELEAIKDAIEKVNKTYGVINGKTKNKLEEISRNPNVLIGQYQAASEGIDGLQHYSHIVIFYSLPESSLLYRQALGRIDRIGQTKVPTYYYLVMSGTVDADIYDLIEKKVEFTEKEVDELL